MSGARYQFLADGGVWDLQRRARVLRDGSAAWDEYQTALTKGEVPLDPDPIGQLSLDEAKANRIADINAYAAARRNAVVRGRSAAEMAGWAIKLVDALAVMSRQPSPFAPILPSIGEMLGLEVRSINHALGSIRGITEEEHAGKVIAQAVPSLVVEVLLDAVRGKHCDAIEAMTDIRDLLLYDWLAGWPKVPG